jgi:heavy metal translocating P-type ATPase
MHRFIQENPASIALLALLVLGLVWQAPWPYVLAILTGIVILSVQSWERIRMRKWDLDYIAFLALVTSLLLGEWLAGAIIALMISLSRALENYGTRRAEASLEELFRLLPKSALVDRAGSFIEIPLQEIRIGETISIRHREMVPLDGMLVSESGLFSEANLTGEVEPVAYRPGRRLRSGIVNMGEAVLVRVAGDFGHSTYQSMLSIVSKGKQEPSSLVRLAGRLNWPFTLITLILSVGAYLMTGDMDRFLAVLVIATPCPLLIAAPIAFLGGLSKAARRHIIIKTPETLERLANATTIYFDKTGTLTLGVPALNSIQMLDGGAQEDQVLAIASAIEEHSLHPIARALVAENRSRRGADLDATDVTEKLGEGIYGQIDGQEYRIEKSHSADGMAVELRGPAGPLARFIFDDVPKPGIEKTFAYLMERGFKLSVLTGDREENAHRVLDRYGLPIIAECDPARKYAVVEAAKNKGEIVIMVGDGVNDAPALALADVGVVFSGTENSLSLEAADAVILKRDIGLFQDLIHVSRRSYRIARQSMLIGIGLSIIGMFAGAFGYLPPVQGAILQEVIDALVIVNAVRAAYR